MDRGAIEPIVTSNLHAANPSSTKKQRKRGVAIVVDKSTWALIQLNLTNYYKHLRL